MPQGDEHIGIPWILVQLGWSAKGRPKGAVWTAKSGIRTIGDPRFGLPFARDRMVGIGFAREAARAGPSFSGNVRDFPELLGLSERMDTTCDRVRRVASCWYERPESPERPELVVSRRYALVERLELCDASGDFAVTLTAEFMAEIRASAPASLAVVRALATKPGALDLYLWQASWLHRGGAARADHGQPVRVPMCDADGPGMVLPGSDDASRIVQEIRRYNIMICGVWPESPFWIAPDGKALLCGPVTSAEPAAEGEPAQVEGKRGQACPPGSGCERAPGSAAQQPGRDKEAGRRESSRAPEVAADGQHSCATGPATGNQQLTMQDLLAALLQLQAVLEPGQSQARPAPTSGALEPGQSQAGPAPTPGAHPTRQMTARRSAPIRRSKPRKRRARQRHH